MSTLNTTEQLTPEDHELIKAIKEKLKKKGFGVGKAERKFFNTNDSGGNIFLLQTNPPIVVKEITKISKAIKKLPETFFNYYLKKKCQKLNGLNIPRFHVIIKINSRIFLVEDYIEGNLLREKRGGNNYNRYLRREHIRQLAKDISNVHLSKCVKATNLYFLESFFYDNKDNVIKAFKDMGVKFPEDYFLLLGDLNPYNIIKKGNRFFFCDCERLVFPRASIYGDPAVEIAYFLENYMKKNFFWNEKLSAIFLDSYLKSAKIPDRELFMQRYLIYAKNFKEHNKW